MGDPVDLVCLEDMADVSHFHQCKLNGKALVFRSFVIDIALVGDAEPGKEEGRWTCLCLVRVLFLYTFWYFHELYRARILRHEQVAQVFAQSYDEIVAIESFFEDLIKEQERCRVILAE